MAEERQLEGQHAVEEAMCESIVVVSLKSRVNFPILARALMRNCPQCQKGTTLAMTSLLVLKEISSVY